MLKSRSLLLGLLGCIVSVSALAQGPPSVSPECASACALNQAEKPPNCDCDALRGSGAGAAAPGDTPLFPDGVPSAADVIFEAQAQYESRMADIENYYFVERSIVQAPSGFTMPGFFQLDGWIPMLPVLRYFQAEIAINGTKQFSEVNAARLAQLDAKRQGGDYAALGANPAYTIGAFGDAFGVLGEMMPGNAAGGAAGGASAWLSGVLKDMQSGITGQEESDNVFGDNNMTDGIGMALEQELLEAAIQGGNDIGLHIGAFALNPPNGGSKFVLLGINGGEAQEPAGGFSNRAWQSSCIVAACGSDMNDFVRAYFQLGKRFGISERSAEGVRSAYVVRFDGAKTPRDIEAAGMTLKLEFAEVWFLNVDPETAFLGPAYEKLVPIRRTLRYVQPSNGGFERVVIDTVSEGIDTEESPMLAPRQVSQELDMGEKKMITKRILSRFKINEGPPTQAEIARLIAEASQDDIFNDPLLKVPSGERTPLPTPAEQPEQPFNPATGPTPFRRPGQPSPPTRETTPIIPRSNN